MGELITSKICTLHELQTVYSYEDALNLWEIVSVNAYNDYQARKRNE